MQRIPSEIKSNNNNNKITKPRFWKKGIRNWCKKMGKAKPRTILWICRKFYQIGTWYHWIHQFIWIQNVYSSKNKNHKIYSFLWIISTIIHRDRHCYFFPLAGERLNRSKFQNENIKELVDNLTDHSNHALNCQKTMTDG